MSFTIIIQLSAETIKNFDVFLKVYTLVGKIPNKLLIYQTLKGFTKLNLIYIIKQFLEDYLLYIYTIYILRYGGDIMAASTTFRDYTISEFLDEISSPSKAEFVSVVIEDDLRKEYKEILDYTRDSIKSCASSNYKAHTFIEESDIEKIKSSLNKFVNKDEKVNEFKKALINDLTDFQKQIKINHAQNIADLTEEKQFCEKQIKIFEFAKHKLVMSRLSKIEWPYDEKTKEYDKKIEILEAKLKKIEQSIDLAKTMRPMAKEKDIIMYQVQLEKKFAK